MQIETSKLKFQMLNNLKPYLDMLQDKRGDNGNTWCEMVRRFQNSILANPEQYFDPLEQSKELTAFVVAEIFDELILSRELIAEIM